MTGRFRRSVLQTGVAVAVGGLLSTSGTSAAGGASATLEEPDGWWTARGDAGNTASVPSGDLGDPATIAWTYEETGQFVVIDGTVYLQTGSGVHAVDADDGESRWEATAHDADGSPTVIDETVYVGGGAVTALDAETGERRWQRRFDDDVSVELVGFGAVYAATDGDAPTLYALDADDGSVRWVCETVTVDADDGTDGPREYVVEPIVAAAGDALYTVVEAPDSYEYALVALEPDSGEARWTAFHENSGTWFAGLAVTEDRAIVQYEFPREAPRVFVFDLDAGEFEGAISDWGYEGVAIDGDRVALTSETRLSFHDVSTVSDDHTETWSYGTATGFGDPVIAGDVIVTATNFGDRSDPANDVVAGFDIADGTKLWRFTFDGVQWGERPFDPVSAPVVDEGIIYITRDEGLVALQPARGGGDDEDEPDPDEDRDDEPDEGEPADESDGAEPADESDGDEGEPDAEDDESDGETEGEESDDRDDENASADDASDAGDANGDEDADGDDGTQTDDSVPGFTTGAGVAGGALTLEWLRRRAGADRPDE